MPKIEQELTKLAGAKYFDTLDLSHGYWKLPLDAASQDIQSFKTPDGIYSKTRALHGTTNAVTHLQSALASTFLEDLHNSLLYWLENILAHKGTIEGLLDWVEKFFSMCST